MRLRNAVAGGLVDAGLSSFSTLGIGVYAVAVLSAAELGAYALFFSGFTLAAAVPTQLLLAPAEFATVTASPVAIERLGLLRHSWRFGVPCALVAAVVVAAAACLAAEAPAGDLWPLALTTATCAIVSPLQDHVRRLLHLAGASWRSALVSMIQLSGVAGALGWFALAGVRPIWRPLGALAAANSASLVAALALVFRRPSGAIVPRPRMQPLLRTGRSLLTQEMATIGAFFVSSALVTRLAGPEALGLAEAARVVGQPLFVLIAGLNLVLGPRSVEAAAGGDRSSAAQLSRLFTTLLVGGGVLLGATTAVPWAGNPIAGLLPEAYTVRGLVATTVFSYVLIGLAFAPRAELIGAQRGGTLIRVGMLAGALQCVATAAATWTGPFARPLGMAVYGGAASLGLRIRRRAIYPPTSPQSPEPGPAGRRPSDRLGGSGSETFGAGPVSYLSGRDAGPDLPVSRGGGKDGVGPEHRPLAHPGDARPSEDLGAGEEDDVVTDLDPLHRRGSGG